MVHVILFAVDEALVNACPWEALVSASEAQGGGVAEGDTPFTAAMSAVGFAEVATEHGAELFDVGFRGLRRWHAEVEKLENVFDLWKEGFGVVGDFSEFVSDELHADVSAAGSDLLEFRVWLEVGSGGREIGHGIS